LARELSDPEVAAQLAKKALVFKTISVAVAAPELSDGSLKLNDRSVELHALQSEVEKLHPKQTPAP
jgi:hypothetical protein